MTGAILLFILFWLGFSAAVATAADTRGRSFGGWFVLALIISPLLAVCFLLASPKIDPNVKAWKATLEQIKATPSGLGGAAVAGGVALAFIAGVVLLAFQGWSP